MTEKEHDYRHSINLAISNAGNRMRILDNLDRESIKQEYREWLSEDYSFQSILLVREDPII